MKRLNILAVLIASLGIAGPVLAAPDCSQYGFANLVEWPENDPVWAFCWRGAPFSLPKPLGSGLEILDAWYNGHKVLESANVPILNVQYTDGACAACFRDWMYEEVRFEALGPDCANGGASSFCNVTQEPRTVCDCAPANQCGIAAGDACGVDVGSFTGTAAEDLGDRLVLTSQMRAGWYRYLQKWVFHLDGTIEPVFGFSSTPNACTDSTHMHHAFYRFDFDIDGASGDRIVRSGGVPIGIDGDGDGVDDALDNCRDVSNPDQCDADGDGFGNYCDGDINNSGGVANFADLALFKTRFGVEDPVADLDCSGGPVNFADLLRFRMLFGTAPGPAGTAVEQPVLNEASGFAQPGEAWVVSDAASARGYRLVPGTGDHDLVGDPGAQYTPMKSEFANGDYWLLRQNPGEEFDGSFFCEAELNDFVTGESVDGEDVVVWYRLGDEHPAGDECYCGRVGPRLEPVGNWSP